MPSVEAGMLFFNEGGRMLFIKGEQCMLAREGGHHWLT